MVLPERARGKLLELWWQDESGIGQQSTLTRVGAERGSRPAGQRDQRYTWAYLSGAVCPARGLGAGFVLPAANAAMMNLHFAEIVQAVALGAYAMLVLDGAGWHQNGRQLVVPDNLTLVHLPLYSPESNLVWNVWAYLRGNQLGNRAYDGRMATVDA